MPRYSLESGYTIASDVNNADQRCGLMKSKLEASRVSFAILKKRANADFRHNHREKPALPIKSNFSPLLPAAYTFAFVAV